VKDLSPTQVNPTEDHETCYGSSPLMMACSDFKAIKALVEEMNADPDLHTSCGSPLVIYVLYDLFLKNLIYQGSAIQAVNWHSNPSNLRFGIEKQRKIIFYLLKKGAKPNEFEKDFIFENVLFLSFMSIVMFSNRKKK
jgi:hypothetical protein